MASSPLGVMSAPVSDHGRIEDRQGLAFQILQILVQLHDRTSGRGKLIAIHFDIPKGPRTSCAKAD